MIQFNLKNDYKHGVVTASGIYSGYPVTIVDNKTYDRRIQTLLHLSPKVRQYFTLELYHQVLYLHDVNENPYRMFDYTKVAVSKEEALQTLREVFYKIEPTLQTSSLVGTTKKGIQHDPNYYEGTYVLNDEETYSILKCRDTVKFFKGEKTYYPDFKNEEGLLGVETIDFDLYALSLEYSKTRQKLFFSMNQLLDENKLVETTIHLKEIEKELDSKLKDK